MPLSMTCGQNPFEVQAVRIAGESRIWLLFSPGAYIQGDGYCYAIYEVELLIRRDRRVYAQYQRTVRLRSSPAEQPENENVLSWAFSDLPADAQWELLVRDAMRHTTAYQRGTFSEGRWAVAFSEIGRGFITGELRASLLVLYRLPPGVYLGQAALYRSASALPELKQYLSIEERRFTLRATGGWDTLRLGWRVEELPPDAYLIGLYLYRGEALLYQTFYSARRR